MADGLSTSSKSEGFDHLIITINGKRVAVRAGTSVAAAVALAHASSRRSVLGSPRGPLCGMGICFECRLTIDGIPHRKSCQILCRPGMQVSTGA
jgi:hypothetical protein